MTNPLVVVRTEVRDGKPTGRGLWIWCPGCEQVHRPRAALPDGSMPDRANPYWSWNERTDELFTVEPSILVHLSVHLCAGEHPPRVCPNPDSCGATGHMILNDDGSPHTLGQPDPTERMLGHGTDHTRNPAFGSCHSFVRNGRWQFLNDSAHHLAGQTVPMVPVPDWVVGL